VRPGWEHGSGSDGEDQRKRITVPINRDLRFAATENAKGKREDVENGQGRAKKSNGRLDKKREFDV